MTRSSKSRDLSMRSRNRARALLGSLLAATALALLPVSAATAEDAPPDDPNLNQTIDPNQSQGTGQVVLDDGHIDFGPTLSTGEWIVQIHDDTGSPSYWRMPSDVVAQVHDAAKLTIPDNDAYSFLGLEPGADAWVIPQVRQDGVIWAGWNTQEPHVLDQLSTGTTLTILGVQGPGDVSVYLQSGNFGEPDPLCSTHEAFPQDSWIEVNTHTHANWVFSEPGVYLVEVQFSGELIDGTSVSARDSLRFAVGDGTDPQEAFAAQFDESQLPSEEESGDAGTDAGDVSSENASGSPMGLIVGIVAGVLGAALIVAIVVVLIARSGAKKRARRLAWERAQAGEGSAGPKRDPASRDEGSPDPEPGRDDRGEVSR